VPYSIVHTILPDYLEVKITGTIMEGYALEEATKRWSSVAALCKKVNRNLILAFVDLKGNHTTQSKFSLVDKAATFGWQQDYKLSVVVKNEEQYNHLLFTETVMNNLGYEMKLFRNKREAKKWLLDS
jgi:hypothetical protein